MPAILQFLLLVVLMSGGVSLLVLLVRHCQAKAVAARAVWADVADSLGGRFSPPAGPWYRRRSTRVEAELGGVPVLLDNYTVSYGQSTQTFTRARAAGPAGHRFSMHRKGAFSGLGRALGCRDVELGDAEYDEAFVVKTDEPQWLADRLSREARDCHLETRRATLSLRKSQVTATLAGFCSDHARLRALMQLAAATSRGVS